MYKLLFTIFCLVSINAYELPKFNLEPDGKPEIVLFNAKSILVNEKLSYTLTWKTINATNVDITFIGKVKLAGSLTITDDEFNKGPITLTASSKKNKYIDKKTINKFKNGKETPTPPNIDYSNDEGFDPMPIEDQFICPGEEDTTKYI